MKKIHSHPSFKSLANSLASLLLLLLLSLTANAQTKMRRALPEENRHLSAWKTAEGLYYATDSTTHADGSIFVVRYQRMYTYGDQLIANVQVISHKGNWAAATTFFRKRPKALFPFKDEKSLLDLIRDKSTFDRLME